MSWTELQLKHLRLKTNLYTENNFWTKALVIAIPSKEYSAFFGNSPTVLLMLSVLNGIHAPEGQA